MISDRPTRPMPLRQTAGTPDESAAARRGRGSQACGATRLARSGALTGYARLRAVGLAHGCRSPHTVTPDRRWYEEILRVRAVDRARRSRCWAQPRSAEVKQ